MKPIKRIWKKVTIHRKRLIPDNILTRIVIHQCCRAGKVIDLIDMHDALSQFEEVDWDEILREKKIDLILGTEQLKEILKIIGNDFDEDGFITANGERIQANDAGEITVKEVKAVLPGSKVFIKNIAGFSQYFFDHKGR